MSSEIHSPDSLPHRHLDPAGGMSRLLAVTSIPGSSLLAVVVLGTLGLGSWALGMDLGHRPLTVAGICITAAPLLVFRPSWVVLMATAILTGVLLSGAL